MKLTGLHESELKETLEKRYDFKIKKMKYIPVGENGASYIAILNSGNKIFVSVRKPKWISIHRQKNAISYLVNLRKLLKMENIPSPIKSKDGKYAILHKNFPISITNFIEGKNPKEGAIPNPRTLAKSTAKLHNFKAKSFPGIKEEELILSWENKILKLTPKVKKSHHEELKKILNGKTRLFEKHLNNIKKLKKHISQNKKKYVLVHTDLHEGNLYISKNKVFILDWESLEKALPEKDLIFFIKNKVFMKEYMKLTKHKPDHIALEYYQTKRRFSDMVYFIREILEKKDLERKTKNIYLKVIKEEIAALQKEAE